MWKKSIPLLMATGLVLTACNNDNNGALPNNNETPMQDVNDRTNQWVPDNGHDNNVNDFDGFQDRNNGTMNGTGTNGGIIDNNGNGTGTGTMDGTGTNRLDGNNKLHTPDQNGNNNASPSPNSAGGR